MGEEPKEVELKLRVASEDIVALRNHTHFAATLRNPVHEAQLSTYFDTDARDLRGRRVTLRVRRIGDKCIQTIKTANDGPGFLERSEWEQAIEGDRPDLTLVKDTAVGPLITDVCDALKPVFETRIERTSYHLNGNASDIVMAVGEGQIVAGDSSVPVAEIELELKQGTPADLFKIARQINEIVPAHLEAKSKADRGYELLENESVGAEKGSNAELSAGMTTARAFTLIGRSCLRHLVANVPATISRDAEALHQMRIALRRLRTAISLFSEVVSDDRVDVVKAELRWLARECGPARDLDTLLVEVLRPLRRQYANQPGLVSVCRMFERKRLKSYRQAQQAIQSDRFRALLLDTAEWIEAGPWSTSEDAMARTRREEPIEVYASDQLSRRYKKIRRRGKWINELSSEQLHGLRIQVKKARYAIEFFFNVYQGKKSAKRFKSIRSCLTQLQNCLGEINDIATRKQLFAGMTSTPARGLSTEQNVQRAFAAGLVIGDQQAKVLELVQRATKAHSRLDAARTFWKVPPHARQLEIQNSPTTPADQE
ncbi:MAG: CYTH and CHAD domain-containing protein [Bradyrhizobium sp.]|nr:CYTH and CHAD domain-containing protein [Bradyrhizobium sp.]